MTVLAIMTAYNEGDIIHHTVRDLVRQNCEVMVIDCDSTDDTRTRALHAGAYVARFPVMESKVSWRAVLAEVENWAADNWPRSCADWIVHVDADELRRAPLAWQSTPMPLALEIVSAQGYNAIDHEVFTFHPVDNNYDGSQDPEQYFSYYTRDHLNERIGQVKAWRNTGRVELAWSGGHRIRYADGTPVKVFPEKFICKHYPIRSQQHGERKVFQERRGRWSDPEKDWHIQYNGIEPGHNFLKDPKECEVWQ